MAGSSAAVVVAAPDPEISRLLGSGARIKSACESNKILKRAFTSYSHDLFKNYRWRVY